MLSKIGKATAAASLGIALAFGAVPAAHAVDAPITSETPTPAASSAPTPKIAKKDRAAIEAYKAAKADFQTALTAFKTAKQEYEVLKAAHRVAMDELKPALTTYSEAKKVIGQTFSAAINAAKAAYDSAVTVDSTSEQKLAAKATFEAARTAATATRTAAISALGVAPVKPAAPVKPTKPVKPSRP
jgi:hypothetical protein